MGEAQVSPMTRAELAAAIRELPEDEKLELLSELWDSLDHSGPLEEAFAVGSFHARAAPRRSPSEPIPLR